MTQLQMDFETYCELPEMNASTLIHGCKSMLSLKNAIDGKVKPPTPAMAFGNKYHKMVLEPDEFARLFVVMPNFAAMPENVTIKGLPTDRWGTKFCNESKAKFEAEAERNGKEVITRAEYDKGMEMCRAIEGNSFASQFIRDCETEVTLLGEIDDVPFKSRLDLDGGGVFADLKGTVNAAPVAFGKQCANLRYGFKTGIYREIYRQNFGILPDVFLIAVESDGDFDCCVYEVPAPVLDDGLNEARRVIANYKAAMAADKWPGVSKGEPYLQLFVPNWAMPEGDLEWE